MNEEASRETVKRDIEGVHYSCDVGGCEYDGYLIPNDWDTRDWAHVVCPRCFEPNWVRVYE